RAGSEPAPPRRERPRAPALGKAPCPIPPHPELNRRPLEGKGPDWEQEEEEVQEEEEEEEEEEKRSGPARRKGGPAKRMAEKASDEETAQFEAEEKGVKISDSQSHLHGDGRLWKEGEGRYGHRHGPPGHPLKKRHHEDEERELEKLEEIEHALKKVAEKLRELRRG
uniref:Uncharacterized protein n=1 Tax=Terrapene triunguis TaxID=2587831 RepID=A0A674IEQ5_9SAUR